MAPASGNCFVVQSSTTTLSDFTGYSMLIDRTAGITDTASMDNFLMARFDNNTGYIQGFRSFFGCPNWTGSNQRYHMSFYEGELIFLAQNNPTPCPAPASGRNTQLCRSTCVLAKQALQDIFNNPAFCTETTSKTGTIATNRATTLSNYDQICAQLPNTGNCLQAVSLERNTCGFLVARDATAYCREGSGKGAISNDPCCAVFLGKSTNSDTGSARSGTSNSDTGSSKSGATNSGSGSTGMGLGASGLNAGNIPNGASTSASDKTNNTPGSTSAASGVLSGAMNSGMGTTATTIAIVVGFLGGLVIIIALYMFITYRNKRGQQRAGADESAAAGKDTQMNSAAAIAAIRAGGAQKGKIGDGERSPVNVFATRQRGGSADPILPNAAASGFGGYGGTTDAADYNTTAGTRGAGGVASEYLESEFDYAPVGEGKLNTAGAYSWMKEDGELFADSQNIQDLRLAEQDDSRGQSFYSEMGESANDAPPRSNNFASVYSEALSSVNDRPITMSSLAQDGNLYSEYAESEYRPVSYAFPSNESQYTDGADMNQSYTGAEDGGMFKVKVLFQYEKDMDDELSLRPGEIVTVMNLFDDGWANGVIAGRSGAFPLACVVPLGEAEPSIVSDSTRMSVLKRRSSLNSNQINFQ
ncbi:hypothetical protein HDU77_009601 [Chytriomyces hyalinus]|nr:hypothetical protein HDU77_009601 [Chytriomyces hyalinus]